jgi:serine protease inhibitor
MERDNMFNMDTRIERFTERLDTGVYNSFSDSKIGEITGESFVMNNLDQGMPMRSINENYKEDEGAFTKHFEHAMYNPQLDFDLYNSKSNIEVSYFDPQQLAPTQHAFSDVNSREGVLHNNPLNRPLDRSLDGLLAGTVNRQDVNMDRDMGGMNMSLDRNRDMSLDMSLDMSSDRNRDMSLDRGLDMSLERGRDIGRGRGRDMDMNMDMTMDMNMDMNMDNFNNNIIASKDPLIDLSSSCNIFSVDMLNRFTTSLKAGKPFVISPFSVLNLMCILYRGSKGRTEAELKHFLKLPDKEYATNGLKKMVQDIYRSGSVRMHISTYFPNIFPLNQSFVNYMKSIGIVDNLDLNNLPYEVKRINQQISHNTGGTIKNAVEQSMINQYTCMILVSTIYFYSKWRTPFDPKMTQIKNFYSTQHKRVPMMHQDKTTHMYFEDNLNQILEMRYTDGQTTMGFILPKGNMQLNLTNEQFGYYISRLSSTKIDSVQIPKFQQQSKFKIDNLFKKMGMKELFTNADLSEITPTDELLYVSDILHQAFINVDEQGTEAGAVTAATVTYNVSSSKGPSFIANHPFIYYIRFVPTNSLLFIGTYY